MGRNEVVRVFTELVLGQPGHEVLNRARPHPEQENTAEQFEEAVDPLEDDANLERDVNFGTRHARVYTGYNRVMARDAGTPPRRGMLFRLLWPVTSYLVTTLTVTVFWVFFFVLNRTRVTGRKNVGTERNTLLLSNHQSMLDSFLVGLAAYYPRSLFQPRLLPWNPAAAGTARSARAAPDDSSPAAWGDDALPGGHADAGWLGGRGTSGDGAAHSRDAGARDSRGDRGKAGGASHRLQRPPNFQADPGDVWAAGGLCGVSRATAHAGDGPGVDRPRDGGHSGAA